VLNKKSLESIIKAGALDQFNDRKILLDNLETIMDWIKNAANADQGLFGGMESSISLKSTGASSHLMERLMMEQEVLKSFVSGNPLDGLYKYIKKFTFLSVVKEKQELGNFIIIGYIKEIQRAKKKGFFIKVEDITDSFEFFVASPCGLEKFDIIIIHGYKKNRIQISKIIKTSYTTLRELAGSAYDPEDTVAKVKKARYESKITEDYKKISEDYTRIAEDFGKITEDYKKDIQAGKTFEEVEDEELVGEATDEETVVEPEIVELEADEETLVADIEESTEKSQIFGCSPEEEEES
jgi:DNA polymerase III alpha subunit